MKKFITLFLCVVLSLSFTACGDNSSNSNDSVSNDSSQINIDDNKGNGESSENKSSISINIDTDNKPATKSVHVIKNFFAVEGAVIYDQTYDEYGYPDCCYFHKKCEACGDVSNNNGSTRGNITTSYYCPKCKTSNHVEIKADSEWIEVYE